MTTCTQKLGIADMPKIGTAIDSYMVCDSASGPAHSANDGEEPHQIIGLAMMVHLETGDHELQVYELEVDVAIGLLAHLGASIEQTFPGALAVAEEMGATGIERWRST